MAQVQMHQGYVNADGRLDLLDKLIQPPRNLKVTVFWEEPAEAKNVKQERLTHQQKTVLDVLASFEKINKDGLDQETLEAFESLERGDSNCRLLPC